MNRVIKEEEDRNFLAEYGSKTKKETEPNSEGKNKNTREDRQKAPRKETETVREKLEIQHRPFSAPSISEENELVKYFFIISFRSKVSYTY